MKCSYHSKVHRKSGNEIRSEKNSKAKNLKNRHRLIRNICIYFRDALQYIWQQLKKPPLFTVFFYFILKFTGSPEMKTEKFSSNRCCSLKTLLFISGLRCSIFDKHQKRIWKPSQLLQRWRPSKMGQGIWNSTLCRNCSLQVIPPITWFQLTRFPLKALVSEAWVLLR